MYFEIELRSLLKRESDTTPKWTTAEQRFLTNATVLTLNGNTVTPFDQETESEPPLTVLNAGSLSGLCFEMDNCRQALLREALKQNLLAGTVYIFVKDQPVAKPGGDWTISFYMFFRYDVIGASLQEDFVANPLSVIEDFLKVLKQDALPDLKIGDPVVLHSGGHQMTINGITGDTAECVWAINGDLLTKSVNIRSLARAPQMDC